MKREGRQHGMVRTYPNLSAPWNSRSKFKNLNELSSPPTAGIFTKVSSKPTSHSKFTGKCGRVECHDCHIHPASKSKNKVKGSHKKRSSSDVMSNYKLITWRVTDDITSPPNLKFSGFSATKVLNSLICDEFIDNCNHEDNYENDADVDKHHKIDECGVSNQGVVDDVDVDNNEDEMSFCEVGFVWQPLDGDESWCLVEEM